MKYSIFCLLGFLVLVGCGEPDTPKVEADPCGDAGCQAIIRSFGFGADVTAEGQDVAIGFDLDGYVTEQGGETGCGIEDLTSPDGVPGIDNQLGRLVSAVGNVLDQVSDLVDDSIIEGGVLYVVEYSDWNGGEDDDVNVRILDVDSMPLVGNDGKVLSGQTVALDPRPVMATVHGSVDSHGVFESDTFDLLLPIEILDVIEIIPIRGAKTRFTINADGTLSDGVIGGALMLYGIIHVLDYYAVGDEIRRTVPPLLNLLADTQPDEAGDCQGLSVALSFDAVPGFAIDATAGAINKDPNDNHSTQHGGHNPDGTIIE